MTDDSSGPGICQSGAGWRIAGRLDAHQSYSLRNRLKYIVLQTCNKTFLVPASLSRFAPFRTTMKPILALLGLCALYTAHADSFSFDDGNRLSAADQSNGLSHSYGYDDESNLLSGLSSGAITGTNGIADFWQNFFFGTTGINALASAVGDGVSNLTKYALGLNPLTAVSGQLVTVAQQVFTDGLTYKYLTFTRSKANASLVSLEQSSDQVMWQGGDACFELVSALDLGDGTEQVTYRNLTPLPNSLFFRLVTNGGSPDLLAYNNITSGTPTPAMPWWVFAILLEALPLVAARFLGARGA
ncbi:MAG: hypothetical protein WC657_07435, partial [Candidatus Paceibacterota bacterium]